MRAVLTAQLQKNEAQIGRLGKAVLKNPVEKLTDGVYVVPVFKVDACSGVSEDGVTLSDSVYRDLSET